MDSPYYNGSDNRDLLDPHGPPHAEHDAVPVATTTWARCANCGRVQVVRIRESLAFGCGACATQRVEQDDIQRRLK